MIYSLHSANAASILLTQAALPYLIVVLPNELLAPKPECADGRTRYCPKLSPNFIGLGEFLPSVSRIAQTPDNACALQTNQQLFFALFNRFCAITNLSKNFAGLRPRERFLQQDRFAHVIHLE